MRIINFTVCDDIRREIGGKNTIVGVYNDLNIMVKPGKSVNWPLHVKLAFFIQIRNEKQTLEANKYEFLIFQESQQIAQVIEDINIPPNAQMQNVNLALVVNSIGILKPGKLDFQLRFFKDDALLEELKPDSLSVKVVTAPQLKPA